MLAGIADNMSLVLVPMVGNEMSADALGPLNEVQNKLRDNRVYIGAAQGSRQKRRPFGQ